MNTMEEKTPELQSISDAYDASDKPFDFVEEGTETAIICEPDSAFAEKISNAMKTLGYRITEAASAKEALKFMRFHVFNVVILNENFDTDNPAANSVLDYLANLNMSIRRQIFVALISSQFRTSDNMAAFNKSVNLIINTNNIDDIGTIIKRGVAENNSFYHVFKEILKKTGRV
jgi:ActR/RegA family two-component response regulator